MTSVIPIHLAVEDSLSEAVIRKLLHETGGNFIVGKCFRRNGKTYLEKGIKGFNYAAKHTPFFVLVDLDTVECAPLLIKKWLPLPIHHNLLFRVAVHEVEAWLIADRVSLSDFFRISLSKVPTCPDEIDDPKACLISLAQKSRTRNIREDIVPKPKSTAKQGRNYNARLSAFVKERWDPKKAMINSPSLHRAIKAIKCFEPQ